MIWYRRHSWCPFRSATRMLRIVQNWVILIVVVEKRPLCRPFDEWSNWKGNRPPSLPGRKHRRRRSWRHRFRHSHPW